MKIHRSQISDIAPKNSDIHTTSTKGLKGSKVPADIVKPNSLRSSSDYDLSESGISHLSDSRLELESGRMSSAKKQANVFTDEDATENLFTTSTKIGSSRDSFSTDSSDYDLSWLDLNQEIGEDPEESIKIIQNTVEKALKVNSNLIHKVMQLDTSIDILKSHMKDLERQIEEPQSHSEKQHIEHQISHCKERISSIDLERSDLLVTLEEHKEILAQNHSIFKEYLGGLESSVKLKTKIKVIAAHSIEILKESVEIVEKIDAIRHFGHAGKLIKEFQDIKEKETVYKKLKEEVEFKIQEITQKNVAIIEQMYSKEEQVNHLELEQKDIAKELKKNEKHIKKLESKLKGENVDYSKVEGRLEIAKSKQLSLVANLDYLGNQVKAKTLELEKEMKELNAEKINNSKELISLNLSSKKIDIKLEEFKAIAHDIKTEIMEEYSVGLATIGVSALTLMLESGHYLATVGLYASHALTALQVAESLVVAAAPVIHATEIIIPIISIPFGIYEIGKSAYEINVVRKKGIKLYRLNTLARQFKIKAKKIQKELEPTERASIQSYKINPEIEKVRLDAEIGFIKGEIQKKEAALTNLSVEKRNEIETSEGYIRYMDLVKNADTFSETAYVQAEAERKEYLNDEIKKLVDTDPLSKEITELKERLKASESTMQAYENIEKNLMKYKIIKQFVKSQRLELAHKSVNAGMDAGGGLAMVGTGVSTIVSLGGVTAPGALPLSLVFALISTGFALGNVAEKAAFSLSNKLGDEYHEYKGHVENTQTGMMYNLGMLIKEEASKPSTKNSITDLVLGYYGLKDPARFVKNIEEKMHKKAKHNPSYAEYIASQKMIIK